MNMNYNYLTTILRSILTKTVFISGIFTIFHFDLEKLISKNCKYTVSTGNLYILGENTSKYRSQIIVVHVHTTVVFSKVHPACYNIANGIKPGSDSKNTDKHAVDCSKTVCWGVK